jgi:23S rRNA G2445 N2-methylase RlmL
MQVASGPSFAETTEVPQMKLRQFRATTIPGMQHILAKEIKERVSDIHNLKIEGKGVSFTGTTKSGFQALMWLRTPLKLMEKIDVSHLNTKDNRIFLYNKEDLYKFITMIDWSKMINPQSTLLVQTLLNEITSPTLTHSHYDSVTIKSAICDQFSEKYGGQRPTVDSDNPMLPLFLYLHKNEAFLYRLWSGAQSLHKRGYRSTIPIYEASLRETTAAACILYANWTKENSYLVDPMCGSGTILIEAALIAANTAPGLIRYKKFPLDTLTPTFLNDSFPTLPHPCLWKDIENKQLWNDIYNEAASLDKRKQLKESVNKEFICFGNDMKPYPLELARNASIIAGVDHLVHLCHSGIARYNLSFPANLKKKITMITNPPWNERIKGVGNSWYRLILFIKDFPHRFDDVYVLSGNTDFDEDYFGKAFKHRKEIYFETGDLEIDLLHCKFGFAEPYNWNEKEREESDQDIMNDDTKPKHQRRHISALNEEFIPDEERIYGRDSDSDY